MTPNAQSQRTGSPYPESEAARLARVEERTDSLANNFEATLKAIDQRIAQRFDLNDKAIAAALLAAKEAVAAALTAAKEAVDKAETAAAKRFEAIDDLRIQIADQAATFIRQDVAAPQFDGINRELNALTSQVTSMAGRDLGSAEKVSSVRADATIRIAFASMAVSFALGVGSILVVLLTR